MGIFMNKQDNLFEHYAQENGDSFIPAKMMETARIERRYNNLVIYLDTYLVTTSPAPIYNTRIRIPFINLREVELAIYRENILSDIGKLFGMQDIQIGRPEFDETFMIKGGPEDDIQRLLQKSTIQQFLLDNPKMGYRIQKREPLSGVKYTGNEGVIIHEESIMIKKSEEIDKWFEWAQIMIDALLDLEFTKASRPNVKLYK